MKQKLALEAPSKEEIKTSPYKNSSKVTKTKAAAVSGNLEAATANASVAGNIEQKEPNISTP